MMEYEQQVMQAARFIEARISGMPGTAVVTGTGIGEISAALSEPEVIPYREIPGFPISTVQSHAGQLHRGILGQKPVFVLQGRFHLYEGYSPLEVSFPIRVLQMLKVRTLILSNAAGGLNLSFRPGDIMVLQDHINLTGANPLAGRNNDDWGIRFPDMSRVYDAGLAEKIMSIGNELGLEIRRGVYAGLKGPSLETPAENRFLRRIGADAVGFSTVMEAIAAVHAGIRILGVSIITNINNPDCPEPTTVEAVLEVAGRSTNLLETIFSRLMEVIDAETNS